MSEPMSSSGRRLVLVVKGGQLRSGNRDGRQLGRELLPGGASEKYQRRCGLVPARAGIEADVGDS